MGQIYVPIRSVTWRTQLKSSFAASKLFFQKENRSWNLHPFGKYHRHGNTRTRPRTARFLNEEDDVTDAIILSGIVGFESIADQVRGAEQINCPCHHFNFDDERLWKFKNNLIIAAVNSNVEPELGSTLIVFSRSLQSKVLKMFQFTNLI